MTLINILDDENLKNPGVYRFVGRNPLKKNKICPLYVGLAGLNAYDYIINGRQGSEPQMLNGRLKRHLANDAGVLGNIIENINDLDRIEFWIVDPREYPSDDDFKAALEYLEYYIRTLENNKPYYDELQISTPPSYEEINPTIKKRLVSIYKNEKKSISFQDNPISDVEQHFQTLFRIFTQTPINQLIKFRQYNKAQYAFKNMIEYWKLIDSKKDYHWILFDSGASAREISPQAQSQKRIDEFLEPETEVLMDWNQWCTKYIVNDIPLFDVDAFGCVNVIYMSNNQPKLARNKDVDDLILSEIEKINADAQFNEGIIAFMYWKVDGSVIPLHVTCTESTSPSNLKSSTLARWGYVGARIFGDLGSSYFGNLHDKFEKWIKNLFSNRQERTLARPVYFWAKDWNKDDIGLTGSHLYIVDFKLQLMQLKNPLLNF